jgi:hypothetical protein
MALMPLGNYSGKGKMDGVFFHAWIIGSFCSVLASCMVWYTLWHDLFERYWFCLLSIDQNPLNIEWIMVSLLATAVVLLSCALG